MSEATKSAPRSKKERLQAAYDAFLAELGVLKKERRDLVGRVRRRLEEGRIDELRKSIKKLT
jgi:hypothetical protein